MLIKIFGFIFIINIFVLSVMLVWPLFWLYCRFWFINWWDAGDLASAVYEEDENMVALTSPELFLVDLHWDYNVWLAEDIVNYFLESDELEGDTAFQFEYDDAAYSIIDYLWFVGLSTIRDHEDVHFSISSFIKRKRLVSYLQNNPEKVHDFLVELKKRQEELSK